MTTSPVLASHIIADAKMPTHEIPGHIGRALLDILLACPARFGEIA
jgi:hypothetical protein